MNYIISGFGLFLTYLLLEIYLTYGIITGVLLAQTATIIFITNNFIKYTQQHQIVRNIIKDGIVDICNKVMIYSNQVTTEVITRNIEQNKPPIGEQEQIKLALERLRNEQLGQNMDLSKQESDIMDLDEATE